MNKKWLGPIILLIFSITTIHLLVPVTKLPLHNYLRELYLIPIILAGLWRGVRGGLTVSIISSLLYLPHFLFMASPQFHTRNIVEILFFNLAGYLVGRYRDTSRQDYMALKNKAFSSPATIKHFLFCIDNTPSSMITAEWFSKFFLKDPKISVTLIWVSKANLGDNFENSPEDAKYKKGIKHKGLQNLQRIKEILLKGGAKEGNIHIKIADCDIEQSVSDKILEELNSGQYDTVLVSKHDVTKTQEFFFGDTTLNLIRKSPIPILVAKGLAV